MRSTKPWKLLAVLVAAMLVGTFAITAVASGKSSDQATFTLVAIPETQGEPIERGFTFTDRLETTDGVPIDGWDGGRCINLNPDPEDLSQWMCELVVRLPEGDIAMAGPFDVSGEADLVFAVTGGTGTFRNARGEVEVVPIPDAEDGRVFAVYRLLGASANY
jgi:hypothetical protein